MVTTRSVNSGFVPRVSHGMTGVVNVLYYQLNIYIFVWSELGIFPASTFTLSNVSKQRIVWLSAIGHQVIDGGGTSGASQFGTFCISEIFDLENISLIQNWF